MSGHLRRHHGSLLEPPPVQEVEEEVGERKVSSQLGVAKKKRSVVWEHFTKEEESGVCRCRHCQVVVASHGGSTSALHLHLVKRHPEEVGAGEAHRWSCGQCGEALASGEQVEEHRHRQHRHAEEWGREGRELRARVREVARGAAREAHFAQGEIEPNMVCLLCSTVVSRGEVAVHLAVEHESVRPGLVVEGEEEGSLAVLVKEGEVGLEERLELERLGAKVGVRLDTSSGYLPQGKVCGDCGKEFSTRGGMRFHWRAVHSGLRPFECKQCGATFTRKDSFESHMVMHANKKPYMCCDCGKTFGRRHARNLHERAHRGDKRFPCSFCGKNFLSGHQKRSHERTHTGERPHQCATCGRTFAQKHQMVTHTRVHTGEKPYQCAKCLQWFKHLSSRRNHRCEGATQVQDKPLFGIAIL